jgi:hypothetical protein
MGPNIEEHQKINVFGNFDDMRVSISEIIQKIDFSRIFSKIVV